MQDDSSSNTTTTTTMGSPSSPLPTGNPDYSSSCRGFVPGDTVRVATAFVAYAQSLAGMTAPRKMKLTENAVLKVTQALRGRESEEGYILELADDVFGSKNNKKTKIDNEANPWRRRGEFLVCTRGEAEKHLEPLDKNAEDEPSSSSSSSFLRSPPTVAGNAPYQDIVAALETSERIFPRDVAGHAASFLAVENVVPDEITACDCSSTRGDHPLGTTLAEPTVDGGHEYEPSTYWISAGGTMARGSGEQFIEYKLSPSSRIRRCHYVGVSIPVLPQGPLSVRSFRVDTTLDGGNTWTRGTTVFETMDLPGMQAFRLPRPVDADRVRLVCLQNAYAASHKDGRSYFDCVGLYRVGWK